MNITGIAGSQRDGNCLRAVQTVLEAAGDAGASTDLFTLSERTIKPCVGSCHDTCHPKDAQGRALPGGWHRCTRRDDAAEVFESMVQADVILMASPVLFGNLSAGLKTLMERTNALCSFDRDRDVSFLAGRYGAAIAVGGARHGGQERVLADIMHYYLVCQMMPVGLGEYQAPQGLALVADAQDALFDDRWEDYGVKQADARTYLEAYGKKLASLPVPANHL